MNTHRKDKSILHKILMPMIFIMIIQSGLFALSLTLGDSFVKLSSNALDILNERVINRRNYIENDMLQRWSNIDADAEKIQALTNATLEEMQITSDKLIVGAPQSTDLLGKLTPQLIEMLRKSSVSGAFVVFDSCGSSNKVSLYLRDSDPRSNPYDNSDLTVLKGPVGIIKRIGIPTDIAWDASFDFSSKALTSTDFYSKPFEEAKSRPDLSAKDLGYWCTGFKLTESDKEICTYAMPIYDINENPIGVVGVELSNDYLATLLPYHELSSDNLCTYVLAVEQGDTKNFNSVVVGGPLYRQIFGSKTTFTLNPKAVSSNNYTVKLDADSSVEAYANIQYFKLYNTNTPFVGENWAIIGIMRSQDIFAIAYSILRSIFFVTIASLTLGIVGIVLTSSFITKPITRLVDDLAGIDPNQPIALPKVNIFEIDMLSNAVAELSNEVADSARRMSNVFELSGISIGAFEYDKATKQFYCSDDVFDLLGGKPEGSESDYDKLLSTIAQLTPYGNSDSSPTDTNNEILYCIDDNSEGKSTRWMRMRLVNDSSKMLGVITDATPEVLEKQKIEYERDYDSMTNLLNRRAFYRNMLDIFCKPDEIKIAALIMLDLDNLKYINDTFGHDYGDDYIRCTADILREYSPQGSVISRMSGDEFYVFIYGYNSQNEIRELIDNIKIGINSTLFPTPSHNTFRVRASAGVAWYPSDSQSFEQLMKYADFAMYKVKNTVKGEFNEFEMSTYNKDSYLLDGKEDLNKLIDEQLVDYHFQPIVDTKRGEVFAYEALMRSRLSSLSSPAEVLNMARSQYKLYQIEKLTWFRSLNNFDLTEERHGNAKLFINSIANQTLTRANIEEFKELYGKYLPRIVVELTEEEKPEESMTAQKIALFKELDLEIAIDDFGTGYNGDATLLVITPNYLKVDMSIVRNVNNDLSRQLILQNTIYYARQKNIKIIAEGVETCDEMEYLIKSGVDYLQGYYIGRPTSSPTHPTEAVQNEIKKFAASYAQM